MNSITRRLSQSVCNCSRIQRRLQQTKPDINPVRHNYEGPGKTTVSMLNDDTDIGLIIDTYSQRGFRLNNGVFVVGPIALFPRCVLSWNVNSMKEVTPQALELFFRLDPKIDILVLGMGDDKVLDPKLMMEIKRRGLNIEALPTDKACSTFNYLNAEYRSVAAALIPPDIIRTTAQDLFGTGDDYDSLTVDKVLKRVDMADRAGDNDPKAKKILASALKFNEDDDSSDKKK